MTDAKTKPEVSAMIPRLEPRVLQRVIERCGLDACSELVALATPEQIARIFDVDLWRAPQPGRDERFDGHRFGEWLEVLAECGDRVAAEKLAPMDLGLLVAGFSAHVRVVDIAAVRAFETSDGDAVVSVRVPNDAIRAEIGGYLVVARRTDAWDAVVAVLRALDSEAPDAFRRVLNGCRDLSNEGVELDGLDDLVGAKAQAAFDVAADREKRRDEQGYVTPADARAFLEMSRKGAPPGAMTANPIAQAHISNLTASAAAAVARSSLPLSLSEPATDADQVGPIVDTPEAVVNLLVEAGLLEQPRALLQEATRRTSRYSRIEMLMDVAARRSMSAHAARTSDLAFLTNTLLAGCSVQARSFTAKEAAEAVIATCNLGLEYIGQELPSHYFVGHDLVGVFQTGWRALHDDVGLFVADELGAILKALRVADRQTQAGLNTLRRELRRHRRAGSLWEARDALEVFALLDLSIWTALQGLLDDCPVIPDALDAVVSGQSSAVNASAFEFIADKAQIERIRDFMRMLPSLLAYQQPA